MGDVLNAPFLIVILIMPVISMRGVPGCLGLACKAFLRPIKSGQADSHLEQENYDGPILI